MRATITDRVQSYLKSSELYKSCTSTTHGKLFAEGLEGYPLAEYLVLLARKMQKRIWVFCPTEEAALQLLADGGVKQVRHKSKSVQTSGRNDIPFLYLPSSGKLLYTPWEGTPREYEQVHSLSQISQLAYGVVVTHLRACACPLVSPTALKDTTLNLKVGQAFDSAAVALRLTEGGYYRTASCSTPGDFSIRGEVIDVFPYEQEYPIRIYADWDSVEKISFYNPITQETIKTVGSVSVNVVSDETMEASVFIDHYISDSDYCVFVGGERLETSFNSLKAEAKSLYRAAFQENRQARKPDEVLFDFEHFHQERSQSTTLIDISGQHPNAYTFAIDGPRSFFGDFKLLREELAQLEKNNWHVTIFAGSATQKLRLETMLSVFSNISFEEQEISGGFSINHEKVMAICDHEIFGRRRQVMKTLHHTQTSPLDSFVDLHEGDYVVHVNYGLGRFEKIDRVKMSGGERDYVKIEYAGKEFLYVPIEQANLIQRYIGSEGTSPRLDKLGGQGWEHRKEKARKSAEELAGRLIGLYARRKNSKGFAFSKDTDWQLQFEAAFPFEETQDQLVCIEDVKQDMESNTVMDRLICGDVGYGKTEIAFRAAFKAVLSGKQVAFLAPTTILTEQHYRNFVIRLGDFPVKTAQLSRMVSKKQQKETLAKLASGELDVIFGTHRILQKDVVFHDLGLLVIDEEQRFGVKDKEKIKELRANIDSLSLSATPIPRTLYMSLLKIRDMSLLTTPPMLRRPVKTIIQHFDEDVVIDAIRYELMRGGQVFYLHNRIETLEEVVLMLQKRLPEYLIEFAHGQMDGEALEDTMRRFVHQSIHVLVSTTIIENGIDIPNVNTIIIDRADMYGVSQLYQLRGRVGRSDREAYAYLLYPELRALSEVAVKRLKVISEHTDLGAGFKVAMKDMEIRGTGNLLGREQSGYMASVGLDMYLRILDEAIAKLQSDSDIHDTQEVFLELDYSGFIPDSYITDPSVKFEVYKKISSIQTEEQLQALSSELEDRFGSLPEEVANLLFIAELKIICRKLDIYHLVERHGKVTLEFSRVASIPVEKVITLIKLSGGKVKLDSKRLNYMEMKTDAISLKDKALFILEQLQRLV